MQISVSSTLTLYHNGQFWVGIVEHVEDDRLGAARIVFGAEPSDEEVLEFVIGKWETLVFSGSQEPDSKALAKNPKRRQREVSKLLKQSATSTKAQLALAQQREAAKQDAARYRTLKRTEEKQARFEQRAQKRKGKKRGH